MHFTMKDPLKSEQVLQQEDLKIKSRVSLPQVSRVTFMEMETMFLYSQNSQLR